MAWTRFGPGTLEYTVTGGAGTATDFAQEIKSGGVQHSYEEVGDTTVYLSGTSDPAGQQRADLLAYDADFDLGAAGLYNFLFTNDGKDATVTYVPNTVAGAEWSGTVRLRLPDGATADGFGNKISGSIEHAFVGPVVFTPATAAP